LKTGERSFAPFFNGGETIMPRILKFTAIVGATLNTETLHIGTKGTDGEYPVSGTKTVQGLVEALAVAGYQCVISSWDEKNGIVGIVDRDNPQLSGTLKMSMLGYPALMGPISEATNPNATKVVVKISQG
jgi:hypothetical protein